LREKTFAPFRYRDFGSMATIGRKSAVAQLGRIRLSGYLAWWLWGLAHIYFLIGFRNRAVTWNYVSFQRGTRLITGADPELDPVTMAPPPAPALRESA
jgi:NADH:ubiquinone reductase (H+-translocating)